MEGVEEAEDQIQLPTQDVDEEFICAVCLSLLLDPTTLNCGHNVCRICVASWYLSANPRRDECPECKQKWEGYPKVNTTLRNLIAKDPSLRRALEQRRVDLADDHVNTLNKFETELQQKTEKNSDQRQSGAFFAGAIFAICAVVVVYFISYWYSGDSTMARVSKPVVLWGKEDVSQWLSSMGWAQNYSINALELSIDGPMLMFKNIEELASSLNITDVYHHSAFHVSVNTLRENGVKMPQSMWEYQALYPGRSLFLAFAMKDSPRITMFFLYMFYYEDSFLPFLHATMPREWNETLSQSEVKLPDPELSQLMMFWLLMMAFPYGMVGLFSWSMRHAHTVTHFIIMITCFLQSLMELTFFSKCLMERNWAPLREAFKPQNQLKIFGSILVFACIWPVCPSFIAKAIFSICIYFTPVQLWKQIQALRQ